jgi:YggT family protein
MIVDTIVRLVTGAIWIETLLIVVSVIISWLPGIKPWHPLVRLLNAFVDPILRPFRRVLPRIAGFDFSPLVAIVVLRALSGLISSLSVGSGGSVFSVLVGIVAQVVLAVTLLLALLVGLRLVLSAFKPSPWNPIVRFIVQVSDPLLRPFSRLGGGLSLRGITLIALAGYFGLYLVASFAFTTLQRLVA